MQLHMSGQMLHTTCLEPCRQLEGAFRPALQSSRLLYSSSEGGQRGGKDSQIWQPHQ